MFLIDIPIQPTFKYIGQKEQDAYVAWSEPYIRSFAPIPTAPLYHYTTGAGLIAIVNSGELWATQLACLNDASELLYSRGRLQSRVQRKLASGLSPEVKFLLDIVRTTLGRPQTGVEGWFVACFTEDGDDLSQWRAYGSGEGGYAIQFNSLYLRSVSQHQQMFLGKVEYDETKQDAFFDDILDQTIVFFLDGIRRRLAPNMEDWAAEFLQCWSWHLAMFATLIKHPKFSSEREWRLVYPFSDEAVSRMRYLQRNSMMTKHVPLQLMMHDGSPRLPLTGVVVGPCRHKQISRISVGDLLKTNGYKDAHVSITDVPYQTV